jgi:predicted ATPase/DNA-binding CsgD family transcriptional regulator
MSVTDRTAVPSTEGQLGTLTFLTSSLQRAGGAEALHEYEAIFTRCLQAGDGRLVELGPDGESLVCVFVTPSKAVASAVAAQKELAEARLKARIAIHTGEAELRHGHFAGPALFRCARLLALAHGGQVILSGPARDLVVDSLPEAESLRDLGTHRLKDLSRPERVFQLLDPALESEFPPLQSPDSRRTNLPEELTSFLGREAELALLRGDLAKHRMVTVTGPGGMGKTRIALHLGAELVDTFPDGVWRIDLAALVDPGLVVNEVAQQLMIREVAGVDLLQTVCSHLEAWTSLLILDNCEHLVEQSAALADTLLAGCPGVKILATSRQPTGATRERVWRLPPLSLAPAQDLRESEAFRLFVDRAWPSQAPGKVDAARSATIGLICRSLEGIPLAIELAAARARVMSVDELLVRLDDRLKVLTGGRGAVPRHQTMRATMDWSYQLLDAQERTLFRRLSVFAGGFTLREVEEICTGDGVAPEDVMDLLARLLEKSLVMSVEVGDQESPMRMLATLRHYAEDRLEEAGEDIAYARRHAEHFLRVAEQARELQNSPQHAGRLDLLEGELDNLRAALAASQELSAELNFGLASALLAFWDERGYVTEGSDWLDRALATWVGETGLRAGALEAAGWLAQRRGDYDRAADYFEDSIRIAGAAGANSVLARSLRNLALVRVLRGDGQGALPLVKEAFDLAEELGDLPGTAGALLVMALATYFEGDVEQARVYAEQSLAKHREVGDEKVAAFLLACLAMLALNHHDLGTARKDLRESLKISQQLREKVDVAFVLESCARLAAETSDPARAIRLAASAAAVRRAAGAPSAPIWTVMVEATLGPAREAVGSSTAETVAGEGGALTLDQALDQALAWLDSSSRPAARPGPLTQREREIAGLVGRGLRNREIAERLFLSVRTVDAHVEHIRDKLDFHSRAQIAAWAVAEGLVRS